ncbi:hypothetical protein SASPL_156119 [Salvia splendens]|uniref:Tobamovirus multiplication protein 2A n=1 Tax=Salvia splendens TaxID=180675 RepID=A0A8X8YYB4_SALSN|nr:hypothetical protein SASPL_156119 [Salvia splendens]
MACKGFWECMLKLLNFLLMVVGLAMVGYGIYLFVKYKNIASSGGDAHPTPLSLELVQLGRPMLLAVSLANNIFDKLPKACMGVIRINAFCVVTVVHSLDSVKPQRDLFNCGAQVYLSLHWNWCGCSFCCLLWLHWNDNSKWVLPDLFVNLIHEPSVQEIPTDKTGNFDKIYEFLEDHWEIVKWVAFGAVILEERISDFIVLSRWLKLEQFWFSFILLITVGMQTIIFLLALIVRAANRPADYDSDEEYIGAPRQQNRQPLINRQTVPTTGVSAANTLDQRPNRNDAWSTRMREKEFAIDVYCGFELMYGLDTSEFTYNPSEAGRHPQAATQPAEEGSRCMIM